MRAREHDIQAAIVDALRLAGFTVRETTAYRQKGGSGVDKGIPDLLLAHPAVPFVYCGIEVKRPGKAQFSSIEQRAAVESSEYSLAQSPRMALCQARQFLIEHAPPETAAKVRAVARVDHLLARLNGEAL